MQCVYCNAPLTVKNRYSEKEGPVKRGFIVINITVAVEGSVKKEYLIGIDILFH